jgi:hypothetical protein
MDDDSQGRENEDAESASMCQEWQQMVRSGAYFDTFDATFLDPPNKAYYIYDRFGGKVDLSSQEALNLLAWLSDQRNEMIRFVQGLKEKERTQYP